MTSQTNPEQKKMTSVKALLVFGTRPEAVKFAPVYHAFDADPSIEPIVCSTGQHREMLDQVIEFFNIPVHHELSVMKPNQTLEWLTSILLESISKVIQQEKPDIVLVQGDTTTSMVGALAAFYQRIPVGHIEAGLRTYDLDAPFPEEMNRQLTGRLTSLHFAPTPRARQNLLQEHIADKHIFVTGNTSIDAILDARERLGSETPAEPYILVTAHRRESFGNGIRDICTAIQQAAQKYPQYRFIYPVHLNPNIKGPVHELLTAQNISLIEPAPYPEFVKLLNGAYFIVSDSGGVQEEAPSLGKPVIVIRDTTERPEGLEAGTNILAGTSKDGIFNMICNLMEDEKLYRTMAQARNPYGDGTAAKQILDIVKSHFNVVE